MGELALVTYSNQLERLYLALRDALFGPGTGPFTRRFVLVPTSALKDWIQRRLAEDPAVGVSTGVDYCFLEEFMGRELRTVPDELALIMKLEQLLLRRLDGAAVAGWETIRRYVGEGQKRRGDRVHRLAKELARHFRDYGIYGGQMVQSWEGWQADLWSDLYDGDWSYPWEVVESWNGPTLPFGDAQVHLFGFSHLAPLYHRFLTKLSGHTLVFYHLLSPCRAYWGDVRSDRERQSLRRFFSRKGAKEEEIDELDGLLRDRNPLVANLGRLGRRFFSMVEEEEARTLQLYAQPSGLEGYGQYADYLSEGDDGPSPTLLEALQADILLLRNPREAPPVDLAVDDSIQVHIAPSKYREIEILHEQITRLLSVDRGKLTPGSILVLAPDVTSYAPYIKAVFGRGEGMIPYQLQDLKQPAEESLLEGLDRLVRLAVGRWEASAVLELFGHPAFSQSTGLSQADLQLLREWVKDTGIRWGRDHIHRREKLAECYPLADVNLSSQSLTWRSGLRQLVMGLAMDEEGIPLSKGEALGRIVDLIDRLEADLRPLAGGPEREVGGWCDYLEGLASRYLGLESSKEAVTVTGLLGRLRGAAQKAGPGPVSFNSFASLVEIVKGEGGFVQHGQEMDAVRFSSLLPMRAVPAPVVCLLGLPDGAFPRGTPAEPFNLLRGNPKADPVPTNGDLDRYLFLEAILSARQHLLCFYQGRSAADGQPQGASPLVSQLLDYLDGAFRLDGASPSEEIVTRHPFWGFHKSYFAEEGSASPFLYRRAMSYYGEGRGSLPEKDDMPERRGEVGGVITIDVGELSASASDPARLYLTRSLGIYLEEEWSDGIADAERLALSFLDQHRLSWEALQRPLAEVIESAERRGELPLGLLREVAVRRIQEGADQLRKRVAESGASVDQLVTLRLSDGCTEREVGEDGIVHVPAVEIAYSDQLTVRLIGDLPYITPCGMLVSGKGDGPSLLRQWPRFLAYCVAEPSHDHQLLMSKSNRRFGRFFDDPKGLLRRYLGYHFSCLEEMVPLTPQWLPDLLGGKVHQLQKRIESDLQGRSQTYVSPYARWAIPDQKGGWKGDWLERAFAAFEPVFEGWLGPKEETK